MVVSLLAWVGSGRRTLPDQTKTVASQEQTPSLSTSSIVVPTKPAQRQPSRAPDTPTLSRRTDKYLRERSLSWSEQEKRHQKNDIHTFIDQVGDEPVTQYSKQDAVSFKDWLMTSGNSPTTINKYLQKLTLFFKWITNHHEGISNGFDGLSIQRVKETNPRSAYTPQEFRQYVAWARRTSGSRT